MNLARRMKRYVRKLFGGWTFSDSITGQVRAFIGRDRPASWANDPAELLERNLGWVYAAVRAIADGFAGSELRFYTRTSSGRRELIDHPLVELLAHVNPFQTGRALWHETATSLELTGNAYWWIVSDSLSRPVELWMLPVSKMRVIPDEKRFIAGYRLLGRKRRDFSPDEIVHLRYPNPRDPFYGQGPLAAAAETVECDEAMSAAQVAAFRNAVMPGITLTTDRRMSSPDIERIQQQIRRKYAGVERAERTLVLDQGLSLVSPNVSPKEMSFLASSRANADKILAIFGVPPAIAGMARDVNRASAVALEYIFAKYTLQPKLSLVASQITQDLCSKFDRKILAEFDSPVAEAGAEKDAGKTEEK